MGCISGKRSFDTQSDAESALVENHIKLSHREGSGPINVYLCDACGAWHFTSKGTLSEALESNKERIAQSKKYAYWEDKFR